MIYSDNGSLSAGGFGKGGGRTVQKQLPGARRPPYLEGPQEVCPQRRLQLGERVATMFRGEIEDMEDLRKTSPEYQRAQELEEGRWGQSRPHRVRARVNSGVGASCDKHHVVYD